MESFNIDDEKIIKCITSCASQLNEDEEMYNTIKILIDFMQFKNEIKGNLFKEELKK